METHLAQATLNPAEIGHAVGISVRHLHRLFSSRGSTVTECIRERRLQRCRMELCDPRSAERNITEIPFFLGFSDSAQFSRCFKRQFGVSPRTFRLRSWNKSWNAEPPARPR